MQDKIFDKRSAEEQIAKFGFTLAEVNQLGLAALNKFNSMYGENIMNYKMKDMKRLYSDLLHRPEEYRAFAVWLKPRYDLFVLLEMPMRIYVGGKKQFMQRGDEKLEKSLRKVSRSLEDFIDFGYITPSRISIILYYLNLIV